MDKFWEHVDFLIPEDKKNSLSDEEVDEKVRAASKNISQIQTG